jgi:hypothetical protein
VLVDEFTRYKWVYFMRKKSEASEYTRTFVSSFNALLAKRFGADEAFSVAAIHTATTLASSCHVSTRTCSTPRV